MRFLRDAIVTLVLLGAVLALVVFAQVRNGGLSADATPGTLERSVARRLVRLSIPADVRTQPNPFAASPDAWRLGADHFADHCAICHGDDGRGRTDIGQNLYPRVPDFTNPALQQVTDGTLFYIIQNGLRWTGMPAWKHEHSVEDSWRLVSFIRKLPTLTPEEIQSLNKEGDKKGDEPEHHSHETPHKHEPAKR